MLQKITKWSISITTNI